MFYQPSVLKYDRPEEILRLTLGVLHQAAVVLSHGVADLLQPGLATLLVRDVTLLVIDHLALGLLTTGAGLILGGALLFIHNITRLGLNCLTNILIHNCTAII